MNILTLKYETFWSILEAPSNQIKPYSVLLLLSILSLTVWLLIKFYRKQDAELEKTILLWCIGCIVGSSLAGFVFLKFFTVDKSKEPIEKLLSSSLVVEGKISNFSRSYRKSVTIESFTVDTLAFKYEDALVGRFNAFSKTNNGIFQDGLQVRIIYSLGNGFNETRYNTILKIDVAR